MSIKSTYNDESGCKTLLNKQIKQFRQEQKENKEKEDYEKPAETTIKKKKDFATRFPGIVFGPRDLPNKGDESTLDGVPYDISLIDIREKDSASQSDELSQPTPLLQPFEIDYDNLFDNSSNGPFDSISDMINDIINSSSSFFKELEGARAPSMLSDIQDSRFQFMNL